MKQDQCRLQSQQTLLRSQVIALISSIRHIAISVVCFDCISFCFINILAGNFLCWLLYISIMADLFRRYFRVAGSALWATVHRLKNQLVGQIAHYCGRPKRCTSTHLFNVIVAVYSITKCLTQVISKSCHIVIPVSVVIIITIPTTIM